MYIDMRDDNNFEGMLNKLLEDILNSPKNIKIPIGVKSEYKEAKQKERNTEIEFRVEKENTSFNSLLNNLFFECYYDIHISISNIRKEGSIDKLMCFVSMDNELKRYIHFSIRPQQLSNNIIQISFENSNIIKLGNERNYSVLSYNHILPSVKREIGVLKVKKSFFAQHSLINFQVTTEFGSEDFSFFADEILY